MRTYRKILYQPSAGDLDQRITISQITESINEDGYRDLATMTTVRSCRAAVLHNSPLQLVAADAQQIRFDETFVIRSAQGTPIAEGYYITWNEENYRIVQVDERRLGPLWSVLRAVKTGGGMTA